MKNPYTPTPACASFAHLLPVLADHLLSEEEAAATQAHLETCSYCQAELASYHQTDSALRSAFALPAGARLPFSIEELSAMFSHPTGNFDAPKPPIVPSERPVGKRRFFIGLPALAATLLIIVLAVVLFGSPGLLVHRTQSGEPTTEPTGTVIPATSTGIPTAEPTATPTRQPTVTPTPQGPAVQTYSGNPGAIRALAWSPNGKLIASTGGDSTIHIWDALSGQTLLIFRQHTQLVNALAWSPDGTRIVSASGDYSSAGKSQVFVWNASTGQVLLTYTGNPTQVNAGSIMSLAWSPDGSRIVSRGADGTLQIWDPNTGTVILSMSGGYPLAWSPDSKRFAMGNGFGADIRDAATGNLIASFPGQGGGVTGLAWSPDGTRIVVGDDFGKIHVLDSATAQPLLTYQGFAGAYETLSMAWSPDSKRIATGGNGIGTNVNTVQIWDSTSGQTLYTYRGQSQGVNAVGWSSNDLYIASGGQDGTIQVWKAP